MLKWLVRNAINRPVTVIMTTILVLVLGLISANLLPIDFYPAISVPKLTVATSYAGLPAKEVLELLTIPVEDSLSSLQGLKHITSSSLDGISLIELKFAWGTDMKQAGIQAREMADLASLRLPEGSAKPMVLPVNPTERPILVLGIFPRENMDMTVLKRLCDREIRTIVQQAEGVGSIEVLGGLDEEILIEPDPSKISTYNLTIQNIAQAIQSTNVEIPAGSIEQGSVEYVIKTDSTAKTIPELEGIYINSTNPQTKTNSKILLSDFAHVSHSTDDRSSFVSQNGQEGIALLVRSQGGYSPVSLSKNIAKKMTELEQAYGKSLDIRGLHDSSLMISESISDLISSALLGFIVAFIVIILYLKDISSSLIMITAIPLSLVMTLAIFPLVHVSVNIMSIGGLAIGIGMLVDDSVVVLENIQRKSNPSIRESVVNAALEIADSTVGSTVTSLIVFLPLFFLPGIIGAIFKDLAWAVSLSVFFSFIVSITVIPVLYCYFGSAKKASNRVGLLYRKCLRFFLRKPVIIAVISLLLLIIGGVSLVRLDKDWLNTPASDEYAIQIAFPSGTTPEYLMKVSNSLSRILESMDFIKSVYFYAGGKLDDPYYLANKSPENEILNCQLMLKKNSILREKELKAVFRKYFSTDRIDDITITPSSLSFNEVLGLARQHVVTFMIPGDRYETAHRTASGLLAGLKNPSIQIYPNATRSQILVTPNWNAINRMDIDASSVANLLGSSVFGVYAGSIEEEGRRVPVRIRFPLKNRSSIEEIKGNFFPNAGGSITPLSGTIIVHDEVSPPVYYRSDRQNNVYMDVPDNEKALIQTLRKILTDRNASEWQDQLGVIFLLFSLSIFLMYIILGIQFDSFLLPLLMLAIIPFGFAGVFIALYATGGSINLNSILGSLVVIGFIVRNGIIFYDHYSALITSADLVTVNIYKGANDRIRAISISFLTTLLALIPIALDISGKNPQQTMAIAITGGLLFSSFLSLFIFPIIYKVYFDIIMRGSRNVL